VKAKVNKGGRVQWSQTPGFTEWFKKHAPDLTDRELCDELNKRYKTDLKRSAIHSMRASYGVFQTAETRQRAYEHRSTAMISGANVESRTKAMERVIAAKRLRELERHSTLYDILGERILKAIEHLEPPAPAKSVQVASTRPLDNEEAVLLISDVQMGTKIDLRDSGGLGAFNARILQREVTYLQETVTSILTRYHPNVRKLHIFYIGDMVEGETIFPGQLRSIDMNLVQQVLFGWDAFAQFTAHFAGFLEQVDCWGVIGNHGRLGKKGEHSPLSNFDYLLYKMMADRHKTIPNIRWTIPETWWAVADVLGWKWLLVHGDDAGQGWAGIPFYAFIRHKQRYRELLRALKNQFSDFDYMAAGHISQIAHFNEIWINGSWPGGTEFSLKRLQLGDLPAQWLIGVHEKYGTTWARPIKLRPPGGFKVG